MRDLIATLDQWAIESPLVAMATVVGTAGSTPRPTGARLAIAGDGRMAGSVSGGCLEAAVVEEGLRTLAGTEPARLLHYGIADELGWSVGLACGGEVDIFVEAWAWEPTDPLVAGLRAALAADRAVALCTAVGGSGPGARALCEGSTVVGELAEALGAATLAAAAGARLRSGLAGVDDVGGVPVFIDPLVPASHLVIVGAVHTGAALARLAKTLGYRVTVIDPREAFCTKERIPDADALLVDWPQRALAGLALGPRDAAVCLTHDPKFDDPTLRALVTTAVGYIGAIGSRRTQATRAARLAADGVAAADLLRVHGPVGLDLRAATPEETALAILAEVVAVRRGGSGGRLGSPAGVAVPGGAA